MFSSFTFNEPLYTYTKPAVTEPARPCNFITFLSVAQALRIRYLPIHSQIGRPGIGIGGTSQIQQSVISPQAGFAFKCVRDFDKVQEKQSSILDQLICEIKILRHPSISAHQNVIDLEGICWDIPHPKPPTALIRLPLPYTPDKHVIWPVLVFQKADFGNLYEFLMSPTGRQLDMSQRLNIYWGIGSALVCMQTCQMIHGDIKPQNVLIFKDSNGSWVPKLADFGYSVWNISEDETQNRIQLPRSWPWHAPEYFQYPECTTPQAMRMDIFSFGLLGVWLLFEKHLSGLVPLDMTRAMAGLQIDHGKERESLKFLDELKERGLVLPVAQSWVASEKTLDGPCKALLHRLFQRCLEANPSLRETELKNILWNPNTSVEVDSMFIDEMKGIADTNFQISRALYFFYTFDFRLRRYIFASLKSIVTQDPKSPLSIQLSMCYDLSFGHGQDEQPLRNLPSDKEKYDNIYYFSRVSNRTLDRSGDLYRTLRTKGQIMPSSLVATYQQHNVLSEAEVAIRQEITGVQAVLGLSHTIIGELQSTLCNILMVQSRWHEAEKSCTAAVQIKGRYFGRTHPTTLREIGSLGQILREQRRWKELERLLSRLAYISRTDSGPSHPNTLSITMSLASAQHAAGRRDEANQLLLEALSESERSLGSEHDVTLYGMHLLVDQYMQEGRFQEAEAKQVEAVRGIHKVTGSRSMEYVVGRLTLATIYANINRPEDAKMQNEDARLSIKGLVETGQLILPRVEFPNDNGRITNSPDDEIKVDNSETNAIIEYMMGMDVDKRDNQSLTALMRAVREGRKADVKLLLSQGADIEARGENYVTPLIYAAQKGHADIIELLIEHGSIVEARGPLEGTALSFAAGRGHTIAVRTLLDKGADMESQGADNMTPLLLACRDGHDSTVNLLLSRGASITARDASGQSALVIAILRRHDSTTQLLLDYGFCTESKDNDGFTPLMRAVEEGYEVGMQKLLKLGVNVNAKDKDGFSALSHAVQEFDAGMIEALVANGADIENRTNYGMTPLMLASKQCGPDIVELLLSKGANVEASSNDGSTPLSIATERGDGEIIQQIESRLARLG